MGILSVLQNIKILTRYIWKRYGAILREGCCLLSARRNASHVKLLMLLFVSIKVSTFSTVFGISIFAEVCVTFCSLHRSVFCFMLKRTERTVNCKWFVVLENVYANRMFWF